jgi:hypothetical protein
MMDFVVINNRCGKHYLFDTMIDERHLKKNYKLKTKRLYLAYSRPEVTVVRTVTVWME